jgi:hypothetical protein
VDWGEAREILEVLGGDDLSDLCYILGLPYSGTIDVKTERILNSEYDVEYVRRRVNFLLFGLTLVRSFSAAELADITREYDLHTYRSMRENMVEILKSEEVSPRVLLGQFTIHVLRDVYIDVYGKVSDEGRDEIIRDIIAFFELEWMSGGMALGFIMMAMKKDDDLERTYQVIKEVCGEFDIRAERIDEIATSGVINDEVLEKIKESEYLFVDLTFERPNVYYELGYTHGLDKSNERIILMARKGTKLHFDIRNMRTIFYRNHEELRREVRERLKRVKKG